MAKSTVKTSIFDNWRMVLFWTLLMPFFAGMTLLALSAAAPVVFTAMTAWATATFVNIGGLAVAITLGVLATTAAGFLLGCLFAKTFPGVIVTSVDEEDYLTEPVEPTSEPSVLSDSSDLDNALEMAKKGISPKLDVRMVLDTGAERDAKWKRWIESSRIATERSQEQLERMKMEREDPQRQAEDAKFEKSIKDFRNLIRAITNSSNKPTPKEMMRKNGRVTLSDLSSYSWNKHERVFDVADQTNVVQQIDHVLNPSNDEAINAPSQESLRKFRNQYFDRPSPSQPVPTEESSAPMIDEQREAMRQARLRRFELFQSLIEIAPAEKTDQNMSNCP